MGFAETLWIDSDIVFEPDEVDLLRSRTMDDIRTAGNHPTANGDGLPLVVSGVYSKKGLRELAIQMLSTEGETLTFGKGAPFRKAIYAPGGMLLVRRQAYERVATACRLPHCTTSEPFGVVPFFMPMIIQEGSQFIYLCEDFAFSRRLRDADIDIWIDMQMRLYHLGNYPYSWEDAGKAVERFLTYKFVLQPRPDATDAATKLLSPARDNKE